MNTVNLDTQDDAVKRFFQTLPIDQGGAVLTFQGQAFTRIVPIEPNTEGTAASEEEWTDSRNDPRCDLIDKEIEGTITPEEARELDTLQQAMLRYRRRVAPLSLEDARRLHQELLRKGQRANRAP